MDQLHWERVGASYNEGWEKPGKQVLSSQELDFVGRHLRLSGAGEALDVGIGNGRVLGHLLDTSRDTRFHGVDFAQAMVDVCRARFAREPRVVELARADVAREPIPFPCRFGFVSAIRVLKYSAGWAEVVNALVDRLEPGGTLVFSMPNRISINRFSKPYAVPWYMTTAGELREQAGALGTSVVEMRGFPRLPYVAYERARGRLLTCLLSVERVLAACCGDTFLGRELFVAARKV